MKWFISQDTLGSDFKRTLELDCGQRIAQCYQCGKCSAGCPVAFYMDYLPNQIMRMVQLGMEKQVLSSRTIWLCASCLTCTVRCPREIDVAEIMDYLRRRALREGVVAHGEAEMPLFNAVFLKNIEVFGRLYEIGLIGAFNLLSGGLFRGLSLAPKMFLKEKIGLRPHRAGSRGEMREIFARSGELERPRADRMRLPRLMFRSLWSSWIRRLEKPA